MRTLKIVAAILLAGLIAGLCAQTASVGGTQVAAELGPFTSSAIGGSLLTAGIPVTTTITATGATTGMGCLANPSAGNSLIAGTDIACYVSSANTVTLSLTGIVAVTPASQTYAVRLLN